LVKRTAFAILLLISALWVANDFLSPLALAAVIAITASPGYTRFAQLTSPPRDSRA
jgi:predicted PurR-regulated permease PerM